MYKIRFFLESFFIYKKHLYENNKLLMYILCISIQKN